MFSTRVEWDTPRNRIAEAIEAGRSSGFEMFDLTESNPTRANFEYDEAAVLASLSDRASLVYSPAAFGLQGARETVAGYYADRGFEIPADRIVLTASTSEAYSYLFKLLCEPGDEVLVPRPSYPLFEFLASLESVRVRQYSLVYHDGWFVDFEMLARSISDKTRAVILVNPNNPTGSYLKRSEAERLASICAEHKLAVISDEVFADFAMGTDSDRVACVATDPMFGGVLTFSLSGLSKVAGLPQMKLGWIAVGGRSEIAGRALHGLELIADTFLSVGAPVQNALPALLSTTSGLQEQIRSRCESNLKTLAYLMEKVPECHLQRVEGGWYATVQVPRVLPEDEWVLRLLEEGVVVQPGYFFDFESEAYLVVSLLTEPTVFAEGSRRVADFVRTAIASA